MMGLGGVSMGKFNYYQDFKVVLADCLTKVKYFTGFLIASFCDEEIEAVMIAIASFFPNIILSGWNYY